MSKIRKFVGSVALATSLFFGGLKLASAKVQNEKDLKLFTKGLEKKFQ